MMTYRDIAFCTLNESYIDPAIVSLISFCRYNHKIPVICYLEEGGNYARLIQALSIYHNVSFKKIAFPSESVFSICGGKWLLIPREAMSAISARITILEQLSKEYDRIINFDLDTLFCNNINNLLSVADDRHIFGVDEKENRLKWLQAFNLKEWIPGDYYFNTGFCLYGAALIRDINLYQDYISEMNNNPEQYNCPEQDYLNYRFHNEFIRIRPSFNMLFNNRDYTSIAPVMIHYYGTDKPWSERPVFTANSGFYIKRYANAAEKCRIWLSDKFLKNIKNNISKKDVLY